MKFKRRTKSFFAAIVTVSVLFVSTMAPLTFAEENNREELHAAQSELVNFLLYLNQALRHYDDYDFDLELLESLEIEIELALTVAQGSDSVITMEYALGFLKVSYSALLGDAIFNEIDLIEAQFEAIDQLDASYYASHPAWDLLQNEVELAEAETEDVLYFLDELGITRITDEDEVEDDDEELEDDIDLDEDEVEEETNSEPEEEDETEAEDEISVRDFPDYTAELRSLLDALISRRGSLTLSYADLGVLIPENETEEPIVEEAEEVPIEYEAEATSEPETSTPPVQNATTPPVAVPPAIEPEQRVTNNTPPRTPAPANTERVTDVYCPTAEASCIHALLQVSRLDLRNFLSDHDIQNADPIAFEYALFVLRGDDVERILETLEALRQRQMS